MFRTPSSIVVAGPSGCGKTYFVSRLLEEPGHYFQSGPPPALHYCYGAWQPGFEPLKKRGIHFHEGLPQTADLDTWYPPEGGLLILDDLMEEGATTNGCWICLPNTRIIVTSPSCICVKICLPRASMPKPFRAMPITWWPSRIRAINWAFAI